MGKLSVGDICISGECVCVTSTGAIVTGCACVSGVYANVCVGLCVLYDEEGR